MSVAARSLASSAAASDSWQAVRGPRRGRVQLVGLLAGRGQLVADLLLALLQLGVALRGLLLEHRSACDQALLDLVAVLLRLRARLLDDRGRLPRGVRPHLRGLLLRDAQQLLRAVPEAVFHRPRLGVRRLGPQVAQLPLGRLGVLVRQPPLALRLGQVVLQLRDLVLQARDVVVDLTTLVAAQDGVEGLVGRGRRAGRRGGRGSGHVNTSFGDQRSEPCTCGGRIPRDEPRTSAHDFTRDADRLRSRAEERRG
jgi:hypothetical protein